MEQVNKKVYRIIKGVLIDRGITQQEVGKKIGFSESTMSRILTRLKNGQGISQRNISIISEALSLDQRIFFKGGNGATDFGKAGE